MAFAVEKLLVYQKSVDFADVTCQYTEQFSRGYGFLVDPLNRAALSISANIAEGNGRFTKPSSIQRVLTPFHYQDGDLPFSNVLSEEICTQALAAI